MAVSAMFPFLFIKLIACTQDNTPCRVLRRIIKTRMSPALSHRQIHQQCQAREDFYHEIRKRENKYKRKLADMKNNYEEQVSELNASIADLEAKTK